MKTQAEKKVLLQFKRFADTNEFNEVVAEIRDHLSLPSNGLTPTQNDLDRLWDGFWIPENHEHEQGVDVNSFRVIYEEHAQKIYKEFSLMSAYYGQLIRSYVYYNKFFYNELLEQGKWSKISSLCTIQDLHSDLNELLPKDNFKQILSEFNDENQINTKFRTGDDVVNEMLSYVFINSLRERLEGQPIALLIHPNTSQRDVLDYVKKKWKDISDLQDKHRKRIGDDFRNSKTKINERVRRRNDLIYKNRSKDSKQINKILRDNGHESLDYAYISKIIYLETNKREKK